MISKLKPKSGLAHFFHLGLLVLLPALVFILVRMDFRQLALAVILLSKWRMFAVKPRHWPANFRANAVDNIFGIAILIFMIHSDTTAWQLVWAAAYGVWLIFIKPASSVFMISAQALLAEIVGLMALFLHFDDASVITLVLLSWLISYSAARHFFISFEEPLTRFLSFMWAYFSAALTWLLSHWLLFYGPVAQPTLLLSVLGFGLGALYYLEKSDRLSVVIRRQFIFVMVAIVIIVIAFSDWGDKAV